MVVTSYFSSGGKRLVPKELMTVLLKPTTLEAVLMTVLLKFSKLETILMAIPVISSRLEDNVNYCYKILKTGNYIHFL